MTTDNIKNFSKQSVWGMIGLTIITITFYLPFWLRKQTKIVNRLLPEDIIARSWFPVCLITTILNFGMVIPEILTNDHQIAIGISKFIEYLDIILTVIWTFKIRNRMNIILNAKKKTQEWYNAFWTLLFGIFYLQYKINRIQEESSRIVEPAGELDRV